LTPTEELEELLATALTRFGALGGSIGAPGVTGPISEDVPSEPAAFTAFTTK
jgi:hypothetical protein